MLVKRYSSEPGSNHVDSLVENGDGAVVITSLAVVEGTSAIRRKYNMGELSASDMLTLVAQFYDEALSDFMILPLDDQAFSHSIDLVLEDDLRTLDSLQCSAALAFSRHVDKLSFVSADRELLSVASKNGLETVLPGKM